MANTTELTGVQLQDDILNSTQPVLVDFHAAWCGPCKVLAPILDKAAESLSGKARVVKIDVDQEPGLAAHFGIVGVPTLLFIKDGEVVERHVGLLPQPQLEAKLSALVGSAGTGN